MECPYCGEELNYDYFYGRNLRLDSLGRVKEGFQKVGDIYRCDNEECEYQGFFHTHGNSDELDEGYPC
jgi:hypothetical protein